MSCWINGIPSERVSAFDRGLAYGDGLFETIAVNKGIPHLLDAHFARLEIGLKRLKFPGNTLERVQSDVGKIEFQGNQAFKIIVTRGKGQRGYSLPEPCEPTRILTLTPATDFSQQAREGICVRLCRYQLGLNPVTSQIKHLNRLEQVIARAEWDDPDIKEGILCDINGNLIEGTMSNLFWVKNKKIFTPDIKHSGVKGVMRDHLIGILISLGFDVEEGHYSQDALLDADEVFMTNSLIGVWPVKLIDDLSYPIGTISKMLQDSLSKEIRS